MENNYRKEGQRVPTNTPVRTTNTSTRTTNAMPVRRRTVTVSPMAERVTAPMPNPMERETGYYNPKTLNLWLLIVCAVALICYFVLPIALDNVTLLGYSLDVKITMLDLLSSKGKYLAFGIIVLLSYGVVLINAIIMLSLPRSVDENKYFAVGKVLNLIFSLSSAIFGFVAIFVVGFTPIALVTMAILLAVAILGIIVFIKSVNLKYRQQFEYERQQRREKREIRKQNNIFVITPKWLQITCLVLDICAVPAMIDLSGLCMNVYMLAISIFVGAYFVINEIILLCSKRIATGLYAFITKIISILWGIFMMLDFVGYGALFGVFEDIMVILLSIVYTIFAIVRVVICKKDKKIN